MSDNVVASHFDEERAESYDARFAKLVPLRDALHLLMALVLEPLPNDARVLCAGVGTGAELLMLARRFPGWRFTAVDPSAPMLAVCRRRAAEAGMAERCEFHAGYVNELPETPEFHAATSILVSQFVQPRQARVQYFREIQRRLLPDGHLVSADLSSGPAASLEEQGLFPLWQRMLRATDAPPAEVDAMLASLRQHVAVAPAADVAAIIAEAGFARPALFFQTLLIHAWTTRNV
jgi:tRNA (cmo5U34)-methyltransferase